MICCFSPQQNHLILTNLVGFAQGIMKEWFKDIPKEVKAVQN